MNFWRSGSKANASQSSNQQLQQAGGQKQEQRQLRQDDPRDSNAATSLIPQQSYPSPGQTDSSVATRASRESNPYESTQNKFIYNQPNEASYSNQNQVRTESRRDSDVKQDTGKNRAGSRQVISEAQMLPADRANSDARFSTQDSLSQKSAPSSGKSLSHARMLSPARVPGGYPESPVSSTERLSTPPAHQVYNEGAPVQEPPRTNLPRQTDQSHAALQRELDQNEMKLLGVNDKDDRRTTHSKRRDTHQLQSRADSSKIILRSDVPVGSSSDNESLVKSRDKESEFEILRTRAEKAESGISAAHEELKLLRDQVKTLKEELEMTSKDTETKQERTQRASKTPSSTPHSNEDALAKASHVFEELMLAEKNLHDRDLELQEEKRRTNSLRDLNERVEREAEHYRKQLEEKQRKTTDRDQPRDEGAKASQELRFANDKVQSLNAELHEEKEHSKFLQDEIYRIQREGKGLQKRSEEGNRDKAASSERLQTENVKLSQEFQLIKEKLERELSEERNLTKRLQDDARSSQRERQDLQQQLEDVSQSKATIAERLKGEQDKVMQELKHNTEKLQSTHAKLEQEKQRASSMEDQFQRAQASMEGLRKQLDQEEQDKAALMERLRNEQARVEKETKAATAAQRDLQEHKRQLQATQADIGKKDKNLNEKEGEIKVLRQEKQEMASALERSQADMDTLQKGSDKNVARSLNEKDKLIAKAEKDLQQARRSLQKSEDEHSEMEKEISHLQSAIRDGNDKLKAAEQKLAGEQSQHDQAKAALTGIENELHQVRERERLAKAALAVTDGKLLEVTHENRITTADLQTQISQLTADTRAAQQKAKAAEQDLMTWKQRAEALEKEVNSKAQTSHQFRDDSAVEQLKIAAKAQDEILHQVRVEKDMAIAALQARELELDAWMKESEELLMQAESELQKVSVELERRNQDLIDKEEEMRIIQRQFGTQSEALKTKAKTEFANMKKERRKELEDIEAQVQALEQNIQTNQKEMDKVFETSSRLEEQLQMAEDNFARDMKVVRDDLERTKQERSIDQANFWKERDTLKADIDVKDGRIKALSDNVSELNLRLEKSQGNSDTPKDLIRSREQEISRLKVELGAARAEIDGALATKNAALQDIQARLERSDRRASDYERELRDLRKAAGTAQGIGKGSEATLRQELKKNEHTIQQLTQYSQRQEREVAAVTQSFRHLQADHKDALRLLEDRTTELTGARAFLTTADGYSGAEVIGIMKKINVEILQNGDWMTEKTVKKFREFTEIKQPNTDQNAAFKRTAEIIGEVMARALLEKAGRHQGDPIVIQTAFQGCFAYYLTEIIMAWHVTESTPNRVMFDVNERVRLSEPQAVSGRWRAITRRHLLHLQEANPHLSSTLVSYIIASLVDVIVISGCNASWQTIAEMMRDDFDGKVEEMVSLALRLNKMIGEEITTSNMQVIFSPSAAAFDSETMEDTYVKEGKQGDTSAVGDHVLCTTDLGLRLQSRASMTGEDQWRTEVLMKSKVALEYALDFLME